MANGVLRTQLLRTGLSVIAALLLSSAAFAEGAASEDQGITVGEPNQQDDGVQVIVIDDSNLMIEASGDLGIGDPDAGSDGDPGVISDEDGVLPDDGIPQDDGDWTWVDPGTDDDTIIWIDDGACIGVGCVPGDDSDTLDGDDGEVVYFELEGPRPEDCPECRDLDLPVWAYQTGGPLVTETENAPAAKPRRSKAAPGLASDAAACLALHPQLPWLCEWQNGAGS